MTGICTLCLAALLGQSSADASKPRPNPLAPSLAPVSDAEQARFEAVIERFIQFDIGKLSGAAGKKAVDDFNRLPAEAIFALIDGFNRAADMEASCPAVVIGKKIQKILNASVDLLLLTYAKETLGAGVTGKRHQGMLKDVQFSILLRKGAVQRKNLAAGSGAKTGGAKTYAFMSLAELTKAAKDAKGPKLKDLLVEVEKRTSPKVYDVLIQASTAEDKEISDLGQRLLAKHVEKEPPAKLKTLLKHEWTEVRLQAVQEIRRRKLKWGDELIARLQDAEESVRQAARQALVSLNNGRDYGPERDASFGDRETSVRQWRQWWTKQANP